MTKDQNITPAGGRRVKSRKLFWVLLVAILLGIAAGIWIGVQVANQGTLSLTTSAKGLREKDGSIKVRIRAVDALQLDHKLYSLDQTATVKDGQLKIRWQPPDSAKKRASYIEICALDSNTSNNSTGSTSVKKACSDNKTETAYNKVSCPYYIAPNSTGLSGQLSGWNKLDDSQKVGCAGNTSTFGQTSGITALAEIQSQDLLQDSNGILVSENGELTTKDINQLVADAITQLSASQPSAFTFLTTSSTTGTAGADGASGATGPQGPSGVATCPNGNCLSLQAVTPGVQEVGNVNVSGTVIANTFSGDGTSLTNVDAVTLGGNASIYYTNATNLASGTLADARLSTNVTLQGNAFNGASQLVQLAGTGFLPALNGSALTSLNATNISSGTVADARLSANVALLNRNSQTFTGTNALFKNSFNSATAFQIQNAAGNQLLNVDSTNSVLTVGNTSTGALTTWVATTAVNVSGAQVRAEGTSVVANGYVYQIGGSDINSGPGTDTVYYAKLGANGTVGSWAATTSLPTVRTQHTSVVANGYVYVIGGTADYLTSEDTVYYAKLNTDGTVGTWQTAINTLPSALSEHTSVVANGYVYVIGGSNTGNANAVDTVYYAKLNADGSIGAWQTGNAINVSGSKPRLGHTSVVANGYVYVIGGTVGSYIGESTVYYAKLNADGSIGAWAATTAISDVNGVKLVWDHSSVVANGYVYVINGLISGLAKNTVYYAKLNSNGTVGTWLASGTSGASRLAQSSVVANGYIYNLNGYDSNYDPVSNVLYSSTPRVKVAGALDLVGVNGGNLADGETGTGGELTAGNTNIVGNLQVQGQASFAQGVSINKELNVGGSALFKNAADSTTAFQVQNATGTTLLGVDTSASKLFSTVADGASAVGFIFNTSNTLSTSGAKILSLQNNTSEVFSVDKDGYIVSYGHIKSTQTTAPTIGTPSNCGASPTANVAAGSTDSAGSITINAGTGGPTTCDTIITFNRTYNAAPKSIILTPASAISAAKMVYVGAINTTDFTAGMSTAPAASESNTYYYWVVE